MAIWVACGSPSNALKGHPQPLEQRRRHDLEHGSGRLQSHLGRRGRGFETPGWLIGMGSATRRAGMGLLGWPRRVTIPGRRGWGDQPSVARRPHSSFRSRIPSGSKRRGGPLLIGVTAQFAKPCRCFDEPKRGRHQRKFGTRRQTSAVLHRGMPNRLL